MVLATYSCGTTSTIVSSGTKGTEPSSPFDAQRERVIKSARMHLGDKYNYAGNGPDRWDCSGLVHFAYDKAGLSIERTAKGISKMVGGVTIQEAEKGDLIFFKKEGRVFHVSIITEVTKDHIWVVHSTTSRGVIEEDINASPYWSSKIDKVISLAALSASQK